MRSVKTLTKSLARTAARLQAHADRQSREATQHRVDAEALHACADSKDGEASKALRVAANLNKILES